MANLTRSDVWTWSWLMRLIRSGLQCLKRKNTQRNLTQWLCFCPPRPPSKFFCVWFFLHFKEKTQPEHKEFRGLKAPKKGGFRHVILGEIFVFGCLLRPWALGVSHHLRWHVRYATYFKDGPTTTTTIFEFISRGLIFKFGVPSDDAPNAPSTQWGTQRNHKDFSSDAPSNAVWCGIRCETFLENYGCGCVWAVPDFWLQTQWTKRDWTLSRDRCSNAPVALCFSWSLGHTPKGSHSPRGRSKHLLETPF